MFKLNKSIFWDIDLEKIDLQSQKRFIISRILERGTWPDFKMLINFYGKDTVKKEVMQARYLDKKTLRFCSFYFDTAEENFRCFK